MKSKYHLLEYHGKNPYKNYTSEPEALVTQERLKEVLLYDPETGEFIWRVSRGKVRAGDLAGSQNKDGYRLIGVDRRLYAAHRIAWMYVKGCWPAKWLDHRDGDPSNNRFENLRAATPAENSQNFGRNKNNSTGYAGVSPLNGKWRAQITASGVPHFLGTFDTPEEAHAEYLKAKERLHAFQPVPRRTTPKIS